MTTANENASGIWKFSPNVPARDNVALWPALPSVPVREASFRLQMTSPAPTPPLYLTDEQIAHLVSPLKQPAAMIRALRAMGFYVMVRPDGKRVVSVANYEFVTNGGRPAVSAQPTTPAVPDEAALREHYRLIRERQAARRKQKHVLIRFVDRVNTDDAIRKLYRAR
jgi:hypothetical protein